MKVIKNILGFLLFSLVFQNLSAVNLPDEKLQNLTSRTVQNAQFDLGYPGNQHIALDDFYQWYVNSGLNHIFLNNAGDPFSPRNRLNSLEIERNVIEFFAPLYGFDPKTAWGIVTMSGTDGNNHGIYFGYKLLKGQTRLDPILYVSKEAHYSNKRLADLQNIELRLIDCDEMGRMSPDAFRKALNPNRPALIVFTMGSTFKGAVDDQARINAILEETPPVAVYRHVDAALFGGFLPYTPHKDLVNSQKHRFDSIAISGHKFFGMDEPCGIFITRKEILEKQNPFNISYLNGAMPMINCSRSSVNPLKFYWIIQKFGISGFTAQAERMLNHADYLKKRLTEIGWPAWIGEYSNTVFFKRPSEKIMTKYHLAPDYDEHFGGNLAHIVVMQHVKKEVIDIFIEDLLSDTGQ